jgi:hypothetical protein
MGTDFLAVAEDWRDAADALRTAGVPADDPALGVWREAAWVHLLLSREQYPFVLTRLAPVARVVTGLPLGPPGKPTTAAEAVSAAADLFARMRTVVSARHSGVFARRHVCCDCATDE